MIDVSDGIKAEPNVQTSSSATIAACWKATRADGELLAVTTCPHDLLIDGVLYRAAKSFSLEGAEQHTHLAIAMESAKWTGARVEFFEIDYSELWRGKLSSATATLGAINASRAAFNAELLGLGRPHE